MDKCIILKDYLPKSKHVFDLLQFGCPKLSTLLDSPHIGKPCLDHQNVGDQYNLSCSMVKVRALSTWVTDHESNVNLFDTAPRLSTFKGIKMNIDPLTLAKHGYFRIASEKDSICCVFCEKIFQTCNYYIHDCMGWFGIN